MKFENLSPSEILNYGVIGLGFLLALLSFWLLQKEQSKVNPSYHILISVYVFMGFSLFLCVAGLVSEYMKGLALTAAKAKPWSALLDEKRIEMAQGRSPEIYKRGDLPNLGEAEFSISLAGGACKDYLVLVSPENKVDFSWLATWSPGSKEVSVSESGEDWFKTGTICTAEEKEKSATVSLQAKMVRGKGPYAIEVYFKSQRIWEADPSAGAGSK